jgi:hypothetical protein
MISNLTIFPFRANWASPVTIKSTFATNTKRESIPGSITRDSARDFGQRQLKFSIMPYDDSGATVPGCGLLWSMFRELNPPGTILGIPLWCDEGPALTADVDIGATELTVDSLDYIDLRTEGVLWHDSVAQASLPVIEGFTIDSIAGNVITLSSALETAFKAGDSVLPLMRGFQIEDYAESLHTPSISELELSFAEDLASLGPVAQASLPVGITYLGLPVLPTLPEWSESPKVSIGKGTHLVASGLNRQALATLRTYVRQRISHKIGLDGRADRANIWQFFHDRRGRWDRFWLPSMKDELKLSANIGSSDTFLTLANYSDFSARFNLGGSLRKVIFITDGFRWWIRQVINLSGGGANKVSIDHALGGVGVPAGGCRIGLMPLVSFATDDIEIECFTPTLGRGSLAFTELEHEYSEVVASATGVGGTVDGMEIKA